MRDSHLPVLYMEGAMSEGSQPPGPVWSLTDKWQVNRDSFLSPKGTEFCLQLEEAGSRFLYRTKGYG